MQISFEVYTVSVYVDINLKPLKLLCGDKCEKIASFQRRNDAFIDIGLVCLCCFNARRINELVCKKNRIEPHTYIVH